MLWTYLVNQNMLNANEEIQMFLKKNLSAV